VNAQKLGFGNRVCSFNKPVPACPNEDLASYVLGGHYGPLGFQPNAHRNLEHVNPSYQNARSAYRALDGRHLTGAKLAGMCGPLVTLSAIESRQLEQANNLAQRFSLA